MASIQIREIETPIEDLSYDVAGNIVGGGFWDTVRGIVQDVFNFCSAEVPPEEKADCAESLIREIFRGANV